MDLVEINRDARGFINVLVGKDLLTVPEISIFKTKLGMARGGCIHPYSSEHLVVVEGIIEYYYGEDQKLALLKAGDAISIGPNVPHYFLSCTDSIVLEWGPTLEEKQGKYEPFRKIVLEINSSVRPE